MIFFLGRNKIHKKQIQVSLSQWSIFLFLDVPTLKLRIISIILTKYNSPDCPYNNKINLPSS